MLPRQRTDDVTRRLSDRFDGHRVFAAGLVVVAIGLFAIVPLLIIGVMVVVMIDAGSE